MAVRTEVLKDHLSSQRTHATEAMHDFAPLPTLPPLGNSATWTVESVEEREQRKLEFGIRRYQEQGGHLGDVRVSPAFGQVVRMAENEGRILTPEQIRSYIEKRNAATEGPHPSDQALYTEIKSEGEVAESGIDLEPAA